jgi:hypothetical protein
MRTTRFIERPRLTSGFAILAVAGCVWTAALASALAEDPKPAALHPFPEAELPFWLETMVVDHAFTVEEAALASGFSQDEVVRRLGALGLKPGALPPARSSPVLKVLPYPGGRHPRIGFLDGAVDPHRDTKASVFLPWEGGGYVVVDLPEALWSHEGLIYLAHTHIPTVWDKKGVKLERLDWKRGPRAVLSSKRRLPDGVEFEARIEPGEDAVDMELRLRNGSDVKLGGLRAQVCVLLKGAPEFSAQTNDNKLLRGGVAAARSRDGKRWVVTVWERGRAWANPPCPCLHSDPTFPDLEPGKEAVARGRLFFFAGEDLEAELKRREAVGRLGPKSESRGSL